MYFPRNLHSHSRDSSSLDIKSMVYEISRERKKVDLSGDNNRRKEEEKEKGGCEAIAARFCFESIAFNIERLAGTKGGNGC